MTAVKIAITSDLYLGVTPKDRLERIAREMATFAPDVAVIAGDLAEAHADFVRCLKLFRDALSCPVWVLPGDRDFWARPPHDSNRLWSEVIPESVTKNKCEYLEGKSFVINGVAVVGTVGWYDYSSSAMAGIVSDMEFAQQKYLHNADALRIDWEWTDPEFAILCSTPFLEALDEAEVDAAVQKVVVVTHFPILEQQLPRDTVRGLASAYLGNLTLGKKALQRKKVSHVISGHLHPGRECAIDRDGRSIEVRVLGGDYDKPAWLGLTVG